MLPTANLIATAADGQTNGWGQYMNAPATAGTFYLWMLAQNAGGTTIGALVSSAITGVIATARLRHSRTGR